ncbi:MAG TPA: histidine kinase, partial [Candidatus Solibacter sp.]|nr:histidine kinase [Candidatus Solibacter sp.]
DSGTIWVGTVNGLSRYQNGRWTTWTKSRGLPEASIDAIAMDNRNGLWLISAGDLIRVDLASLHESGPVAQLSYTRTDGLRLINGSISSSPIIIRGRQGRMWIATMDGAAVFDPARLIRNRVPPPVVIEQVTVDGQALDIASGEVHYRGRNLQITYTGLSLTAAERARFRYRMNGVDQDWTDAAARRAVAYVDLKPGSYRFQVAAANNDGVWNEQGSSVAIVVDPYFYQTTWFAAICVGIALAIAWGIHQIRVRQVVTRLQVIAAERARFSRELHDSLLQGFSGVIYQLEAAVKLFDLAPAKSKKGLEKALDQADKSLREARQLITSMRIPALDNATLSEALRSTTVELTAGTTVEFHYEVKGRAKPLHYDVEANLFLIAREALTNSLKHSNATRIRMELNYTSGVRLTVEDNGAGFDTDAARVKEGHQGFRGMEERARTIGGQFTVTGSPGKGARIEVSL